MRRPRGTKNCFAGRLRNNKELIANLETCLIDKQLKSKQHILMGLAIGAFNNNSALCFQVSSLAKMFKLLLTYKETDTGVYICKTSQECKLN